LSSLGRLWPSVQVLLDESLPTKLFSRLSGHDAETVEHRGWKGLKNGELLRRAVAAGFEAFITLDRNLRHQQNLADIGIGVVVLFSSSSRIQDIQPLVPDLLAALARIRKGEVVVIGT